MPKQMIGIVERNRLPVNQVVATQQVDTVVIPSLYLTQAVAGTYVHIGAYHQITFAIVLTTDVSIACGAFDTGMLSIAEDRVAVQQVVIMKTIATQGIGCPCAPMIVHVTIQESIVTFLQISFLGIADAWRAQQECCQ